MTINTSYIAEFTSNLAKRFNEVIEKNELLRTPEQLDDLHRKMELINNLSKRGLLNRQEFKAEPSADTFERLYSNCRP